MTELRPKDLAQYIDHTLLRPNATAQEIERLCAEAKEHGFFAVCVNGSRVVQACHFLEGSSVKVATVVGFPLGAMDSDAKRYETEVAVDNGAAEVDVVIDIGRLKDGDHRYIVRELADVREAADERIVKAIIETALLTNEEKATACKLALEAEVHFVKTSTGFSSGGATIEDVRLMREVVGVNCGVKASGGIRDYATAKAMIEAGATRLGTSASPSIVSGISGLSED